MNIKPLESNDTIGIIAPSSPVMGTEFEKSYKRGIIEIKKMGFKIKEGKTIYLKKWHWAGTDKQRANDIMKMFADKNAKAVICAVGGAGANRILNLLDYSIIRKNPKPFMGISDPTVLVSGLFQIAKTPVVYGPDVCFGFGGNRSDREKKWEFSMINKILTSMDPIGKVEPLTKWNVLKKGIGKGFLIGGHLNSYTGLKGTPYFADIKNKAKILFWETTGRYSQMDEDLINLKNSGFFKNVAGMIVGKFNLMDSNKENKLMAKITYKLIEDVLKDYKFPIIADVDFGHLTPNIPLPYGKLARVDGNNNSFEILESLF